MSRDCTLKLGGRSRQAGISLFPAMMFLLVLTVLSIGALNSAMMEEKMVGNTKDTNVAFQMAEAAQVFQADHRRNNSLYNSHHFR